LSATASRFGSPDDLLKHLGVEEPDQIDIEAIAFHCGAAVRYAKLTSCAARIVGVENRSIITVNLFDPTPRKRFSIGHELGHWMHDRGIVGFSCIPKDMRADWGGANKEARANRYASTLLMPRYLFEPRLMASKFDMRTIEGLAKVFGTSITATALRAIELTDAPAILACYNQAGRVWVKRSSGVPFDVTPHYSVHQDAFAFDLLFGNSPSMHSGREIDASKWLGHAAAHRYRLVEHTIKVQKHVLCLLTWSDARFVEELR
jgi:hypothetical protein